MHVARSAVSVPQLASPLVASRRAQISAGPTVTMHKQVPLQPALKGHDADDRNARLAIISCGGRRRCPSTNERFGSSWRRLSPQRSLRAVNRGSLRAWAAPPLIAEPLAGFWFSFGLSIPREGSRERGCEVRATGESLPASTKTSMISSVAWKPSRGARKTGNPAGRSRPAMAFIWER
jgi:hypothetical protein